MIMLYEQVRPVLSRVPFIGGVEFAFENKPQVEVEFSGIGGQVLAQPAPAPIAGRQRCDRPGVLCADASPSSPPALSVCVCVCVFARARVCVCVCVCVCVFVCREGESRVGK